MSNKTDRKEGIRNLENSNSKDQVERIQEIYETYSGNSQGNRTAQQSNGENRKTQEKGFRRKGKEEREMALIKLHLAFSVLCLIYAIGCSAVFKKSLKRFSKKRSIWYRISHLHYFLVFFVPLLNLVVCGALTYMALCDDEAAKAIMEKQEEEKI